ncbi:hypothetical protein GCM10010468_51750 [Actinocorallia longicatena]|uniref:Uncharacterized protein n=1 Tax=Actinocorallia longicatena TaxID=111803 RepID=A0ABP6QFX9_9ACTN
MTSSAAPGVDHAVEIGIRYRSPSAIAATPIVTDSTSSPDAASRSLAPTARSPASTTANELANPTTASTTPAITGCTTPPRGDPDGSPDPAPPDPAKPDGRGPGSTALVFFRTGPPLMVFRKWNDNPAAGVPQTEREGAD